MLDTRTKIVPAETALARRNGRPVVAVYFDPMVASHTRRLRELAEKHGPLTVCVCDPPDPLLPAQARAELAASCRDVENVVIGNEILFHVGFYIDERTADLVRRDELIRHVFSRQNA
jgi:glycerol-3-phosphate cytidylyltransferase-like family protein